MGTWVSFYIPINHQKMPVQADLTLIFPAVWMFINCTCFGYCSDGDGDKWLLECYIYRQRNYFWRSDCSLIYDIWWSSEVAWQIYSSNIVISIRHSVDLIDTRANIPISVGCIIQIICKGNKLLKENLKKTHNGPSFTYLSVFFYIHWNKINSSHIYNHSVSSARYVIITINSTFNQKLILSSMKPWTASSLSITF